MAAEAKPLPVSPAPDRPRGTWRGYALVAAVAAMPLVALLAEAPGALTIVLTVPALAALQWCVQRRGGWRLIGPHGYYDLIRMSRKGRILVLRTLFLCAVVAAIYYTYEQYRPDRDPHAPGWVDTFLHGRKVFPTVIGGVPSPIQLDAPQQRALLRQRLARLNMDCVAIWFLLQNVAILLLTPAYLGGAIAEERERGTLEMLLATELYNREIVLGKLAARLLHLGTFLLAGLPIFSIMLVWGGIDLPILLANWANSVALLLTIGCLCLAFSTLPMRPSRCIILSYAVVLPAGACFMAAWRSGSLEYFLSPPGSQQLSTLRGLAAWYAGAGLISLTGAIRSLRVPDLATLAAKVFPPRSATKAPVGGYSGPSLPPIQDNALWWKERYTGGMSVLLLRQTVLFLALPASVTLWLGLTVVIERLIVAQPQGVAEGLAELTETVGPLLHTAYAILLACYCIGVAFRAAACVVHERQMRTLDLLLQLPVERREILRAKWWGALLRGRPWLALIVADLAVGLAIGAYHPLSAVLLLGLPVGPVVAICSAGMLVSVYARTTVQANLAIAMLMLALTGCFALLGPAARLRLVFTWWYGNVVDYGDLKVALWCTLILLGLAWNCWLLAVPAFERTARR